MNASAPGSLPPALAVLQLPQPAVIAHRGFSARAPENTLAAFRLAVTAGADLVELDYHHSHDGVPVVIHDATLDRTTDAVQRWGQPGVHVADHTWAELQTLDAGSWAGADYRGERLPLLADAVESVQPEAVALVERKAGDAATCAAMLRDRGLINRAIIQAFDWKYLRDFHRLAPEQVLGAIGPPPSCNRGTPGSDNQMLSHLHLDEIETVRARVVVWNRRISQEVVQEAHRRGLKMWIYTVNSRALARKLLKLGVDGLITNEPARMREVVREER